MLLTEDKEIDIFVASRIGSFKHVKFHTDATKNNKKCIENLIDVKTLQKDDTITCMAWGDPGHADILLGKKNQQILIYNTLHHTTMTHTVDSPGHVVGAGRVGSKLLAGVSSGTVKVWENEEVEEFKTGGELDRVVVCAEEEGVFATGGQENEIKVWSLGVPTPTFSGKNLPHDWLQLRQPVWVTDAVFMPGAGARQVAVCSRHGYVRLYDTRAQRRPVCNVVFPNMAATCISTGFDDSQVFVGFGRGQLHAVDLRRSKPDKGFKGAVGAITSIATATNGRYIISGSLDRHVRIHDFGTKELVYKQYLTSKLSCVLVQENNSTPLLHKEEIKEEEEEIEEVDEMDELFDNMESIAEKPKKKEVNGKKNKFAPSIEGSTHLEDSCSIEEKPKKRKKVKENTEQTEEVISSEEKEIESSEESEEEKEDAIKKLLKSTEKQKRRLEKKRREKKRKSVFHNA